MKGLITVLAVGVILLGNSVTASQENLDHSRSIQTDNSNLVEQWMSALCSDNPARVYDAEKKECLPFDAGLTATCEDFLPSSMRPDEHCVSPN